MQQVKSCIVSQVLTLRGFNKYNSISSYATEKHALFYNTLGIGYMSRYSQLCTCVCARVCVYDILYTLPLPLVFSSCMFFIFFNSWQVFRITYIVSINLIGGLICLLERRVGDGGVLAWSPSWTGALSVSDVAGWYVCCRWHGGWWGATSVFSSAHVMCLVGKSRSCRRFRR